MNGKDLMMQRDEFVCTGIIKNIAGDTNKVYNSGWMGSNVTITLNIDGRTQKVKVFGGVGKNEFPIRVYFKDSEGKIVRDDEGKAISQQIPIDNFDPNTQMFFDTREVIEWGEKNAEGKTEKISHISELSDGRFANALMENREKLIGKRVMIKGQVQFRPTQNFDKIQTEMSPRQITLLQPVEEGKTVVDKFVINSSIVLNKEAIDNVSEGILPVYVPVYHKYKQPITRDGRTIKGRTVYIPTPLTVKENGFMNIDENYGFPVEARADILRNKINVVAQDTPMAVIRACLSNKSGVVEREIKIEELLNDQVYGTYAKACVKNGTVEQFLEMYRKQNPYTVRGEYKQQIDFISPLQLGEKKDDGTIEYRDGICGIDPQMIEIYTLDKIRDEVEEMESNPQPQPKAQQPVINTPKKEMSTPKPPLSVSEINSLDEEFPF